MRHEATQLAIQGSPVGHSPLFDPSMIGKTVKVTTNGGVSIGKLVKYDLNTCVLVRHEDGIQVDDIIGLRYCGATAEVL